MKANALINLRRCADTYVSLLFVHAIRSPLSCDEGGIKPKPRFHISIRHLVISLTHMQSLKNDISNNFSNMIFCEEQCSRKLTLKMIIFNVRYNSASFIMKTRPCHGRYGVHFSISIILNSITDNLPHLSFSLSLSLSLSLSMV